MLFKPLKLIIRSLTTVYDHGRFDPEDDFQFASEAERASHINIGMSVQKGNTVLLEAMNDVLSTMTEDDFTELMNQAVSVQPEI